MIDILSSVPLTPSGIKLKSSLPTARWAVLKGQCALPVTCRSPLYRCRKRKEATMCSSYRKWMRFFFLFPLYVQFEGLAHPLTRTAGRWDSLVWLGRGSGEGRWRRQPLWPSSCSNSESRLFPGSQWLALRRPQCLKVQSHYNTTYYAHGVCFMCVMWTVGMFGTGHWK